MDRNEIKKTGAEEGEQREQTALDESPVCAFLECLFPAFGKYFHPAVPMPPSLNIETLKGDNVCCVEHEEIGRDIVSEIQIIKSRVDSLVLQDFVHRLRIERRGFGSERLEPARDQATVESPPVVLMSTPIAVARSPHGFIQRTRVEPAAPTATAPQDEESQMTA